MLVSATDRLAVARSAFAAWRASNAKYARLPASLWQQAVALLDHLPLSVVARELQLNPARLRQKQTDSSPVPAPTPAPTFIQLPIAELNKRVVSPSPAGQASHPQSEVASARLVIERPDGSRLCLVVPSADSSLLEALCGEFLRAR